MTPVMQSDIMWETEPETEPRLSMEFSNQATFSLSIVAIPACPLSRTKRVWYCGHGES